MKSQHELTATQTMLQRHGYEVEQHANNCFDPYLTVQDPVFESGIGQSAGKLVLMGYESVVIRNYDAARKFINARA